MRYSVRGPVGLSHLEAVMRQWIDDLTDHEIDEVVGLSLYFSPRSRGSRVEFRSDSGEVVDHITLEPIARKVYTGTAAAVRAPVRAGSATDRPPKAAASEMLDHANSVALLKARWELDDFDIATLMDSHHVRVSRILKFELPTLMRPERERLALLVEIDRLYDALRQQEPIAAWLRWGGTMLAFPGDKPLNQLLAFGPGALARMRDAFRVLADGHTPVVLDAGFDAIIDGP